MEGYTTYSTFRTFTPHFNALARVGYFKLVMKNPSPTQLMLHNCYRGFIWFLILWYNLLLLIRVVQTRHSTDEMVDILAILLTTLNTLGKQVAFNMRVWRMDRIIEVINGPIFTANKPGHIEIMKITEMAMLRLLYLFQGMAFTASVVHAVYPLINQDVKLFYFSSETSGSFTFKIAHWYLVITLIIQACGNSTMDCTIAGFYAMAKAQFQILRYNLEHLVDSEDESEDMSRDVVKNKGKRYKDSEDIQRRFVHCVQHHLLIKWFVKEVESIFCEAITMQFLIMAFVICMAVYKIVAANASSIEFWYMYLNCMLAQLFIFCYFGTLLKVESEFVAQSAFFGDWTCLSPAFRRQLVILMQCAQPIVPCAAKIVPVSLETYIAVLRVSYTLFTILDQQ